MSTTIDIKKLNTIFNEYLVNSRGDVTFADYLTTNGYYSDNQYTDKANRSRSSAVMIPDVNIDEDARRQYESYLQYLLANVSNITGKVAPSIQSIIQDNVVTEVLNINNFGNISDAQSVFSIDEDAIRTAINQAYNTKTMPKMKKMSKVKYWLKRVGLPALITAGVGAVVGGAIALIGPIAGSIPFLTDVLWQNIATLATLGAGIGAVATTVYITAKDFITKRHYQLHYGAYSNSKKSTKNIDMLTRAFEKGLSISDLATYTEQSKNGKKELSIPVMNLLKLFADKELKIMQNQNTRNPFKKIANYFALKANRNRLHAIVSIYKHMSDYQLNTEDRKVLNGFTQFNDQLENFISALEISPRYADIARRAISSTSKRKNRILKQEHREAMSGVQNEGGLVRKALSRARRVSQMTTTPEPTPIPVRPEELIEEVVHEKPPIGDPNKADQKTDESTPPPTKKATTVNQNATDHKSLIDELYAIEFRIAMLNGEKTPSREAIEHRFRFSDNDELSNTIAERSRVATLSELTIVENEMLKLTGKTQKYSTKDLDTAYKFASNEALEELLRSESYKLASIMSEAQAQQPTEQPSTETEKPADKTPAYDYSSNEALKNLLRREAERMTKIRSEASEAQNQQATEEPKPQKENKKGTAQTNNRKSTRQNDQASKSTDATTQTAQSGMIYDYIWNVPTYTYTVANENKTAENEPAEPTKKPETKANQPATPSKVKKTPAKKNVGKASDSSTADSDKSTSKKSATPKSTVTPVESKSTPKKSQPASDKSQQKAEPKATVTKNNNSSKAKPAPQETTPETDTPVDKTSKKGDSKTQPANKQTTTPAPTGKPEQKITATAEPKSSTDDTSDMIKRLAKATQDTSSDTAKSTQAPAKNNTPKNTPTAQPQVSNDPFKGLDKEAIFVIEQMIVAQSKFLAKTPEEKAVVERIKDAHAHDRLLKSTLRDKELKEVYRRLFTIAPALTNAEISFNSHR